jgi:FolB domain-containing protein
MKEARTKKLDKILIKDLLLRCIIGINESERKEKQDVIINLVLWTDLAKGAETDDIRQTVDYKEITKEIIRLVDKSEYFLVETLAENIAQTCLQHKQIERVNVTVEKPGALRFARSVGVEILRERT